MASIAELSLTPDNSQIDHAYLDQGTIAKLSKWVEKILINILLEMGAAEVLLMEKGAFPRTRSAQFKIYQCYQRALKHQRRLSII